MNDIQIFKNEEFGEIRVLEKNKEAWFCLIDVCKILEINNASQIKSRLNQDGLILNEVIDRMGRSQKASFINEPNLYKTIFQSKKPEAERFTDWVAKEVLPSIRKTGGYILGEEKMTEDELVLKAMTVLNKKVENLKEKNNQLLLENTQSKQLIGELKPKADYTDKILQSKNTVTVTAIAKDYGMSAIEFNRILKSLQIQYKQSGQWFLYEKYQRCGYTHSKTTDFIRNDGSVGSSLNTEWTQKGRLFLYNKLKEKGIIPVIERD